jgi:ATP-dependent helicase/nuclease subunit A
MKGDAIILGADLTAITAPVAPPANAGARQGELLLPGPLNSPLSIGVRRDALTGRGQKYGSNFHRLLELLSAGAAPAASLRDRTKAELGLAEHDFAPLWAQAQAVIAAPSLAQFFEPGKYVRAANEVAYCSHSGDVLRIDRLVEFENEVWVLDYKTGVRAEIDDGRLDQYRAQVSSYLTAMRQVFPGQRVRAALVFADATMLEVGA